MTALHHYLTLQYTPDPLTIYEGIFQLPAGHKIVITQGREPEISRWWQTSFEPKITDDQNEIIHQTRTILKNAVKRHMISDVPLGAFLSGGIDSSIIVALMADMHSKPVKTFSIGFDEHHFSETQYARQIAQRYSTEHHEFIFRPKDLINVIEGVIKATDEPFADPAALPLYELSRQTRKYVTVALSGDGGDETLAGYRRYTLDKYLSPYAKLPKLLTQKLIPAFAGAVPEPVWIPEDKNPFTGLKRLKQFSSVNHKASLVRWGSYFNHSAKLAIYSERWAETFSEEKTEEYIASVYDKVIANKFLDCTLSTEWDTYLSGDLLPKTDRTTMAHSLEARAPYLDAEWVEWTAKLPIKYKVRGLNTKWLLKTAFSDKIPKNILKRGKQGFSVPIGSWLRNDLKNWSHELLLGNKIIYEWLRPDVVEMYLIEHEGGKINHGKRLWALMMFALWIENKDTNIIM
jgi:asparagine synthase (glutamine-hydrolysing)